MFLSQLRAWANRRAQSRLTHTYRPPQRRSRLCLEPLEDRLLLSTFLVTNTNDSGAGSLRQAILDANSHRGMDTIAFNIDGGSVQTINPGSSLPIITDAVIIDGTTQPLFAGKPLIVLNGTQAGTRAGLTISAGSSTVRGLVINSFRIGISLQKNGGNVIQGNYIGTDASGAVSQGNGIGVNITTGTNLIGGTAPRAGNVISGNSGNGITISGSGAAGNVVQGNFIGTDPTGTSALGNGGSGVAILSPGNTVGGMLAGAGNVISGNKGAGISIFGSGGTSNLVQGNFIGTDITGTKALGNVGSGVSVSSSAANNMIGGTSAAARNLISANREGVTIWVANQNLVQGNYIGTDRTGTKAMGNFSAGVSVFGGSANNTIGGTAAGAGNVVAANNAGGVGIYGTGTMNNLVQGNFIGTDSSGTAALGNKGNGAAVGGGAANNTIGGTSPGARNVIAGNIGTGLVISSNANQNFVQGNFIGTDVSGVNPLGNTVNGVTIKGSNNLIGGTTTGAGNTIAFNGNDGVLVDTGTGNGIRQNSIFGHLGLGIQLINNGNHLQPYPILTLAWDHDGKVTIKGTLTSTPNSTFAIEFFWTPNSEIPGPDSRQGHYFFGSISVTTDATGNASFTATFPTTVPTNAKVFATATVTALPPGTTTSVINDTSEFSNGVTPLTSLAAMGFVTGGGWIDPSTVQSSSPATPSSDHRANFGFNAKYLDNDPTPQGHVNFVWQAGSIHFDSTAYDPLSLLITSPSPGVEKATWTGEGTVNHQSGYTFKVQVTDDTMGEPGPDSFRIQIKNSADVIVYDNGSDPDNETVLSGGNIVVHDANAQGAAAGVVSGGTNSAAPSQPAKEMSMLGPLPTGHNSVAQAGAHGFLGNSQAPLQRKKADSQFPFVDFLQL